MRAPATLHRVQTPEPRARARELAAESTARGDPLGWFEQLYIEAETGTAVVPWADRATNPHLVEWFQRSGRSFRSALVVGCGLGDDVSWLTGMGVGRVIGFDISGTAVAAARRRFPDQGTFIQADVFNLPSQWEHAFDFVLEAYTLQVLPAHLRDPAARSMAKALAPGGLLLVIARGRDAFDEPGRMPWPLTRVDLGAFGEAGLKEESFEDFVDEETPPIRRFRAVYRC